MAYACRHEHPVPFCSCLVALTAALGIGTGITPDAKFVPVGGAITAINNTDKSIDVRITITTESAVVFTGVVPAFSTLSYTVVDDPGDMLNTVMYRGKVTFENVTHQVISGGK